jgi:hypothetical protein
LRINRLYLKNFAAIFAALGRNEIELDFTINSRIINIFVGQMGSGKTAILSQLQPFSNLGTLDVRNSNDQILTGENGEKIIEYSSNGSEYLIDHKYIWSGKSHSTKSYISKNGLELNPNGNVSSFRDIIEMEFGLDQNDLKMIRLGPNVANVINLKSTDRKAFIASLLSNTEIYILIYKKLTEEMRILNSQIGLLTNKLLKLDENAKDAIEDERGHLTSKLDDLVKIHQNYTEQYSRLKASIELAMNKKSYKEFCAELEETTKEYETTEARMNAALEAFREILKYPSDVEIGKKLGHIDAYINTCSEKIMILESKYDQLEADRSKLEADLKLSISSEQVKRMEEEYKDLLDKSNILSEKLKTFKCQKTSHDLRKLQHICEETDGMILDLRMYDKEIIKKLYRSDSSVISYSKKQIERLMWKKQDLQKTANSVAFSATYDSPYPVFRAPFCPTKDCPYYQTHPQTISRETKKDHVSMVEEMTRGLDDIDKKINILAEYPRIYAIITRLRENWRHLLKELHGLDIIRNSDLLAVITDSRNIYWYTRDSFDEYIRLCVDRENYSNMIETLSRINTELTAHKLNSVDSGDAEKKLLSIERELDTVKMELKKNLEDREKLYIEQKEYNDIYVKVSNRAKLSDEMHELEEAMDALATIESDMHSNKIFVEENEQLMLGISGEILKTSNQISDIQNRLEEIKMQLRDIHITREELDDILEKRDIKKYIIDAVSTKEGIPLVMVKIFLDECVDIINDLISDVFGETVEIIKFDVNETEFKIPYMVNGIEIEDIENASQGQQSIISIALSFALMRQSQMKYNIMLLDELDGPLHLADRNKFVDILMKQLNIINAEQCFIISHNDILTGNPVNIILTSDEVVGNDMAEVIHV